LALSKLPDVNVETLQKENIILKELAKNITLQLFDVDQSNQKLEKNIQLIKDIIEIPFDHLPCEVQLNRIKKIVEKEI